MGKLHLLQSNFTGGEIDPRLKGRVDIPRYQNGLDTLQNAYVLTTGGATRRPGLRFIESEGNITTRLIPFNIFRTDTTPPVLQGYVIEFRSDNTVQFYTNDARIGTYSITSPFTNGDLSKIRYIQFDNVLYLVHPDFPPQQLTRTTDTSWTMTALSFTFPAPFANTQSVASITRDGTLAFVTTNSDHGFQTGQSINMTGANQTEYNGIFTITVTSNTQFSYTISGTPASPATGTINAAFPVQTASKSVTSISRSGSTATVTLTNHGYSASTYVRIAGAAQTEYNGDFVISVVDANTFTYTVSGTPATPATGTITAQGIIGASTSTGPNGLVANIVTPDVHNLTSGMVVHMAGAVQTEYNGDFVITVTSPNAFFYYISGTPATPATGTLTLQRVYWGTTGYPSACTFFEERLMLANTKVNPQTLWGSESGKITNFATGTGDSDPFAFTLAAATSQICHLSALKQVFISTNDQEMLIQGGVQQPLTPTNVQIKVQTKYGIKETVAPITIGIELLFVTRYGKKVRSQIYDLLTDTYKAPDISVVSAHLAELGIVEMAHQTEPTSIVWMVTSDGKLLSMTFDRDQDVVAWAEHVTDGLFKNVTVIPYNGADEVWVTVQRTVNGSTSTFIEILDPTLNTDAAYTGTDGTGKTTWTGLNYLEGKTVDVLADGVVMPTQAVTGGQIVLPRTAKSVEIGLHYETTIIDLPPEVPTGMGTAQGQAVGVNRITVRLNNSLGCTINGDTLPFRKFGIGILDTEIPPFTGDKFVSNIGWSARGQVTIKQTQPLPFTVLAIIKEVTING